MQYCSLQHWTLLPSPVTSTTVCCFCFDSISSFFLELFLHWSPVAYWASTNLGCSSFSVLSFCLFILFMGYSRQEYWSFSSVAQSCPTLCDPMNLSTPGLPVHHQLPESTQTHLHRVSDAIKPSRPPSSPSLQALNHSQHQDLFKWVNSLHQVAKVLEFHLQHQSFQWTPTTDLP